MVAIRGAEALAEQVGLLRRTEIMASQPGVLEGYTPDPQLSEVVKQAQISAACGDPHGDDGPPN